MRILLQRKTLLIATCIIGFQMAAVAQKLRIDLTKQMIVNEADVGDPAGIVDEQREIIGNPAGEPASPWTLNSRHWKKFPFSAHLDLGEEKHLASLWLFDTNGKGDVVISVGEPGKWREQAVYDCAAYKKWVEITLDATTRYLRLTRKSPGANFSEIAVYEYTDEEYERLVQQKAEAARREAKRQEALRKARAEALTRPLVEMEPYGTLSLVDEIDCAKEPASHLFSQYPPNVSNVKKVLNRKVRVLPPVKGEAAYFSYRIGKMKLLRPGGMYVLAVDYPEDAPRSMVVINTGNETSRGFYTGPALGDAFHAKYVNNLPESIDVPLSERWETWSLLFRLHDRFPERGLVRGAKPRPLAPEDGFDVTIAQFSKRNIPLSHGAAVSRIRLFEVVDPGTLKQEIRFPPEGLPRRHLFWREEMADGIINRKTDRPGIDNPLNWYRYKADLMAFLGMNTYTKDLLEFGACQHWDSTPLGGSQWVFFDRSTAELWKQIVELMGARGFTILPYYEYSGSKGYKGLGNQRRCRPLTRDDAYTHISWIESANADVTDPDTYEDFRKMIELTVIRLRRTASFAGIWIRSRAQLPVSFSDAALARFTKETSREDTVTRELLQKDEKLYNSYIRWWHLKRRGFLVSMRDYLKDHGIADPVVLYTGCSGEPGVPFHTWEPRMVTDRPKLWNEILKRPEHVTEQRGPIVPLTVDAVVKKSLYYEALTSPALNWGKWEVHHARPADDPKNYQAINGVMLTHAINRTYTVCSKQTFDAYRTKTGLAVVRHYPLNENMMFDKKGEDLLGYFIADIERAGPCCMMAEILAMANGDPTMIGYLAGGNFGRGFPQYVQRFNAHFLALPALPSRMLSDASDDEEVVVRTIETGKHGTWLAVINTSLHPKKNILITVPGDLETICDAVTGKRAPLKEGKLTLSMDPCQLRSFHGEQKR